jgi:FAD:protein FMN transferase
MGTDAHVTVVDGPAGLCERAAQRLAELEARWSRFREDSEISQLNRSNGRPVVVSALTFDLLRRAQEAWRRTGGAFDPTVLHALDAAGYDRDFADLAPDGVDRQAPPSRPPGAGVIGLDPIVRAVRLPPGVGLDLGGIGKGVAADQVTAELRGSGARGACVNLGGDLRVGGAPPSGDVWLVGIEPEPGITPTGASFVLELAEAGVATTSVCRRRWRRNGELRHHVIDPRSGQPARSRWSSVTVVAGSAGDAEPAATATLLTDDVGQAAAMLEAIGAGGVAFDDRGRHHRLGSIPLAADAGMERPTRELTAARPT